jgi:hypothetical protein
MRETILIALAAGLLLGTALLAQNNPLVVPEVLEEDDTAEPPAPATGDDAAAEGEEAEEDDRPEYADDLEQLEFSREIAPDEQVTFPVDF